MTDKPKKRVSRGWERKKANHDTYREILSEAGRLCAQKGFEATSMAEVAQKVGIKPAGL